jgi:hypothetical protein
MCTGGAYRPFLHDRHFSAASGFQIAVSPDVMLSMMCSRRQLSAREIWI